MYDYNCPDCNEAKLQSEKNAMKINEVIDQVNQIVDNDIATIEYLLKKADEIVGETAEIKINDVLGDLITEIDDINSSIDDINSSLDNKANLNSVFSMANMGQDIKEAMTGGSVAVVGKDTVLADNIVDGQVYGVKTDFLTIPQDSNLFDKRKITINSYINGGINGELREYENFIATDFIPIMPDTQYYYENFYGGYYAFYDNSKNYITGVGALGNGVTALSSPFTTPTNAYYIRMTINDINTQLNTAWISTSSNCDGVYKYKLTENVVLSDNIDNEIGDKIDSKISKELHLINISEENTTFITEHGFSNPIDVSKIKANTYINGAVDGNEKTGNGLFATDFIRLKPDTQYYYNYLYTGYYAFYDINKNYITGGGIKTDGNSLSSPFTTPSNAYYIRMTLNDESNVEKAWINVTNEKPDSEKIYVLNENIYTDRELKEKENTDINPTEYKGEEITVFNKIICIGDSLTAGVMNAEGGSYHTYAQYSYPTYLKKLTGIEIENMGISGITTKEWYETYEQTDLSGFDCAIIQLGVNDVAKPEVGVTPELTIHYLEEIITRLRAENKNIKIFIGGITKSKWYNNDEYINRNEILKNTFSNRESENIYFMDNKQYSKCYDSPYAKGHLTALGYYQQAYEYKNYISYLINKNINNFADVQFIGTDLIPI